MNSKNVVQHAARTSDLADGGNTSVDNRVSHALEEYAASLEKGQPLTRESLLEKYADVAEELAGCLDSLDFIRQIAPQVNEQLPEKGADRASLDGGAEIQPRAALGDYRIVREIGRGGMGVVYEAEQLSLGRSVALKVLPYAAMLNQNAIIRFKNESRAAATLDHPHIVPVYAVGNERGIYYYAMSLIDGLTIADLIDHLQRSITDADNSTDHISIDDFLDRRGASSDSVSASHLEATIDSGQPNQDGAGKPTDHADETLRDVEAAISTHRSRFDRSFFRSVARLGTQAAEALDHAHQRGIVHRDIKPGNLMIDSHTNLWVTDFGLARIESDAGVTMTGDLVGTLRYMAPEQALAQRIVVDHRADIYALGATLYELLALRPAFDGPNREALLRQIAFEEAKPIRQFNPSVPVDLQTIVHKAMTKNPDDRYATAQEMADDLRAFQEDEPIKARPLSPMQRLTRWAARRKPLVASVAAVLALALIGLSISNAMITHERNTAQEAERNERAQRLEANLQREEAELQKQIAEENFRRARNAVDTYLTKVGEDKLLNAPSMQPLRKELFELALNYYKEFIAQQPDNPELQAELADALVRVGDIVREIGSQTDALASYEQSVAIRERLAEQTKDLQTQLALAEGYRIIAAQFARIGETQRRNDAVNQATALLERLQEEHDDSDELILARVRTLLMATESNPAARLANAQKALELLKSRGTGLEEYDQELARCEQLVSNCFSQVAARAMNASDKESAYRHAIAHAENASKIQQQLVTEEKSLDNRQRLATIYLNLGADRGNLSNVLLKEEETRDEGLKVAAKSVRNEQDAIELVEALAAENPLVVDYSVRLGVLCFNVGISYAQLASETEDPAHLDEAMTFALRARELRRRIESDFPHLSHRSHHACDLLSFDIASSALKHSGVRDARKRRFIEQAMAPILGMRAEDRDSADHGNLARMALLANKIPSLKKDDQLQFLELAIDSLLEVPQEDREADVCGGLGQLLYRAGRYDESRSALEQCIELRGDIGPSINLGSRWWYMTMLVERAGEAERARRCYAILTTEASILGELKYDLDLVVELQDVLAIEDSDTEQTPTQLLDRLLAAESYYWRPYFRLGKRLQRAGETEAAKRAFAAAAERLEAIPDEEKNPADWGFLAQASYESGKYLSAQRALEKNFELRKETRPTIGLGPRWWYRAMLLARAGDKGKSRAYYDILTNQLATHPAPELVHNERYRAELAELLGIEDPPPYSLEGASLQDDSDPPQRGFPTPAQVSDPDFDSIVASPEYESGTGPHVLVDEGHQNFHTIEGRYTGFATLLRRDGYRVDRHLAKFSTESLSEVDVLVIANARRTAVDPSNFSAFDDDEIESLHEWVSAGGSLLLIADHAPFGSSTISLAMRFGIEMTNSFVVELGKRPPLVFRRGAGLQSHPISDGRSGEERVDRVATFTGQAFRVSGEAVPLLVFGEDASVVLMERGTRNKVVERYPATRWLQGAAMQVGKGRVAVFGEASMFSAQLAGPDRRPMGMNSPLAPDNQQFLLNVMHWLSGKL